MNIQVFSENRVKLKVPEGQCDYINASPVFVQSDCTGTSTNFIVMQGPKANTVAHTWRMIWDDPADTSVIVMLTQTHEGLVEKCFPYFPQDKSSPLITADDTRYDDEGNIVDAFTAYIELVDEETTPFEGAIEVRKLNMRVEGQQKEKVVWHLLYNKMVDFSHPVAGDTASFFHLMELSRQKNGGKQNNRIVHCSAGVGRSGTFIALEHLISELDGGALEEIPPKADGKDGDPIQDTVNWLRMQRQNMVQADVQYAFLYDTVRQMWEKRYLPSSSPSEPRRTGRSRADTDPFIE